VARATSTRAATPVAGSSRSHVCQAKARRSTGGGSTRSMEGALVRREPSPLTRRRGRPGLAVRRDGIHGGPRQRASEASSQARRTVENTVHGRQGAEGPSIVAPPGPRLAAHVDVRGTAPARALGRPFGDHVTVATNAEAGGSPSSEAPPGRRIRKAVRQAPVSRRRKANGPGCASVRFVPQGARRAQPGTKQFAGCS